MMTIEHGGLVRRVQLGFVPADWKKFAPMPIVIVLHDERSSADAEVSVGVPPYTLSIQLLTLMMPNYNPLFTQPLPLLPPRDGVEKATFLLVVPEGVSLGRFEGDVEPVLEPIRHGMPQCAWNSGHRGFDARTLDVDDVGFIDALITQLQEKFTADLLRFDPYATGATEGLDLSRIYVAGIGNGAEMAYRLGCELPSKPGGYAVRALAAIGGTTGGEADTTDPTTLHLNDPADWDSPPPDVLIVHGMQDEDFIVEAPPYDPIDSLEEAARMREEVATDFVGQCTPSDYSLAFTQDVWSDYLGSQVAFLLTKPEVVRTLTVLDTPFIVTHDIRVTQSVFREIPQPGSRPNPYSPRYLTTVLDDTFGHGVPVWDLGRLVWESFTSPSSLLG